MITNSIRFEHSFFEYVNIDPQSAHSDTNSAQSEEFTLKPPVEAQETLNFKLKIRPKLALNSDKKSDLTKNMWSKEMHIERSDNAKLAYYVMMKMPEWFVSVENNIIKGNDSHRCK